MHPIRRNRLLMIIASLIGFSIAVGIIAYSMTQSINLYYSPSNVHDGEAPLNHTLKVGGLVQEGSVKRADDSLKISFIITDTLADIQVSYEGILPDLFREGQGVIATGKLVSLNPAIFHAEYILAKHDETYMSPEVKKTIAEAEEQARENLKIQQNTP